MQMFTVQMCPEKKMAFLLRILRSELENVVCLAQMIDGVCLLVPS